MRRAAFSKSQESNVLEPKNLLMLRSEGSESQLKLWTKNTASAILYAVLCILAASPFASAQGTTEFTMTPGALNPSAISPGGSSSSNIVVSALNGFTGSVNLTCQVTAVSNQVTTDTPVCTVSPPSVKPPASATATITSQTQTTTIGYNVSITGTTATPTTYTAPSMLLTLLAVTPQFTITVQTPIAPSSIPAGNAAQGVVNINPSNGYSSPVDPSNPTTNYGVYLSCASVTPLVTIPPTCTFNPPHPAVIGAMASSTITISTFGPIPTAGIAHPRLFYAFWIPVPLLALVGFGVTTGKRSRKAWALLSLFVLSGAVLLLPSCSTPVGTLRTTTPNGITPANTYTFTLFGVDIDGVVSSNTGSSSGNAGPTLSLTVTAPKPQ